MSNLETISQILQESSERTEVTINYNGNEKKFKMKPLTDGELTKLKRIEYFCPITQKDSKAVLLLMYKVWGKMISVKRLSPG